LPRRYRYAFEFRDPSWYDDAVYAVLHAHRAALCISDHADAPSPWVVTAGHVYLRGHGPSGRYHGSYSAKTMRRWADAIASWQAQRHEVFVYFDNDQKAAAPKDARRLIALVKDKGAAESCGPRQRQRSLLRRDDRRASSRRARDAR